jgi:putative SOS response-associated peptidase YedK
MCTNYTPTARVRLKAMQMGVEHLPVSDWPPEIFPGYEAPIIVAAGQNGAQCLLAKFGLMPRWSKDAKHAAELARGTYNSRSETAAIKPSFRSPWRESQFALAPMENFYEPCWETGQAVRWAVSRADGEPFAVAALWERWTDPDGGEIVHSFSLLTVNADGHPLMGRLHRPGDEKRMPVIVSPEHYGDWLHAKPNAAMAWMQTTAAEQLRGEAAPRASLRKARPKPTPAPSAPEDLNLSLF